MKEQKEAPAGKQGQKAKGQMKMRLFSFIKDRKRLLNNQTINELFIVAFLALAGLLIMEGGVR